VGQNEAIQMKGITKRFGSTLANHNVDFEVREGEILSLLGENGSGKTTLMNMLSGIYYPDEGEIFVRGNKVLIRSPHDAYELGIGMIHQHFKLVDVFTAAENVVLGLKHKKSRKEINDSIEDICKKYGFDINPNQKVYDMSVAQKQTLEIIKVLYRGADFLILDEPTAVLTPQETDKLFAVMRNMRKDGKSMIIITHKLHEVLSVSDRVTILRRGEFIGTVPTKDATEQSLTEMMVGKKVELNIERPEPVDAKERLIVQHLSYVSDEGVKILDDISFTAKSGEILGIAGISGCGQKELLEAIAGLLHIRDGSKIDYVKPEDDSVLSLVNMNPRKIRQMGVAFSFVPEDRLGMGLVGSMGMTGNMLLQNYADDKSFMKMKKQAKQKAVKVKEKLDVVTPGINTPVRKLSGGNVQKVLVGREIGSNPTVLMTAYAVRGLDIHTSHTIYHLLNKQKKKGSAVLFVGEDLDVLMALSDRIMVMCGGKMNGILDARTATKEEVGLRMTKIQEDGGAGHE